MYATENAIRAFSPNHFRLSYDGLVTVGSYRDNLNRHTCLLLDKLDILLELHGEVIVVTNLANIALPTLELGVNGLYRVVHLIGEMLYQLTIDAVSGSYLDGIEVVHNVRLHHDELCNTIHHHGILQCYQVKPAATTRATRNSTKLMTDAAQLLTRLIEELGGEGTTTHAGAVGLENTIYVTDLCGRDTQTGTYTSTYSI